MDRSDGLLVGQSEQFTFRLKYLATLKVGCRNNCARTVSSTDLLNLLTLPDVEPSGVVLSVPACLLKLSMPVDFCSKPNRNIFAFTVWLNNFNTFLTTSLFVLVYY